LPSWRLCDWLRKYLEKERETDEKRVGTEKECAGV